MFEFQNDLKLKVKWQSSLTMDMSNLINWSKLSGLEQYDGCVICFAIVRVFSCIDLFCVCYTRVIAYRVGVGSRFFRPTKLFFSVSSTEEKFHIILYHFHLL